MDRLYSIQSIFAERVFRIPDYQRGYAWGERQLEDFLLDLELLPEGREHYFGTLILHAPADRPKIKAINHKSYTVCDVVDGQQRLTTVVLLLDAIRRELAQLGEEDIVQDLQKTYVAIQDANKQLLSKLTLNRDCHDYFQRAVLGLGEDVAGTQIRSHDLLKRAKERFAGYLAEKEQEKEPGYVAWLVELYDKTTQQLALMVYEVGDEAEAGVIFETMNDRGKPITDLEKVKNYLLYLSSKLVLEEDHTLPKAISETWTHVFEHLMAADLGTDENENQLLRAHWLMAYDYRPKEWGGSRSIKARFGLRRYHDRHLDLLQDILTYVETLRNAATAYCDVLRPGHTGAFNAYRSAPHLRDEIARISEKLVRMRLVAPFVPLLIAVRLRFPEDPEAYLKVVSLCEKFAFRVYSWRRARSDTGVTTLYRLSYELYLGYDLDGVLDELRRALLRYCSDARFRQRFVIQEENDWYSWSGIKYFLYEYEEHLAQVKKLPVKMPWEDVDQRQKQDTVEHILPQTPEEGGYWTQRFSPEMRRKYTHDIGNLCLTYHNPCLGNRPFLEKVGAPGKDAGYVNSILFTEKQLAGLGDWDEGALLARRKEIEAWALERWHVETPPPPPKDLEGWVDQCGVRDEFQAIWQTAQKHGLYPRVERWCVWYTPPSNRTRALFTVWPKLGRLDVGVWLGSFSEFFPVTGEREREILGATRWRSIGRDGAAEFTARLDRLFEEIAQASKEQSP